LTLVTNKDEKRIRNYYLIIDVMLKTFKEFSKLIVNTEAAASKDKDLLYHLCSCESLGMPILTTWALRNRLDVTEDLFIRKLEIDCKGTVQVIEKNAKTNILNNSHAQQYFSQNSHNIQLNIQPSVQPNIQSDIQASDQSKIQSSEVFIQIACGEIKADSGGMFFLFLSVFF
jgi:hypothetical protein